MSTNNKQTTDKKLVTRRKFLATSSGTVGALAVGLAGFPIGNQVVDALASGANRVKRTYPRMKIASVPFLELKRGAPLDFSYPLETNSNFLIKLGTPAVNGVGPDKDIVAFSYQCSHMGCPLNGKYNPKHKMLGPCPCHFTQFDLTKSGDLVIGQATQSLPQILLEVKDGEIEAIGVTGLIYGSNNNLEGGKLAKGRDGTGKRETP